MIKSLKRKETIFKKQDIIKLNMVNTSQRAIKLFFILQRTI
jgi:hypothetical protein